MSSPMTPPVWKVSIVSWVPGSSDSDMWQRIDADRFAELDHLARRK